MRCEVCHSELPEGALFCGECGSSLSRTQAINVVPEVVIPEAKAPEVGVADEKPMPVRDQPETTSTNIVEQVESVELSELFDSLPQEPVVLPRFADEVELGTVTDFTVTLATGESVVMSRSALVGRMPQPVEGEEFEHLIVVHDPGRSVSKTHLELGVDQGQLWMKDRGSGNGSIVREPGFVPRRAQPGTRYDIVRGTRIDMGDLHLTIG